MQIRNPDAAEQRITKTKIYFVDDIIHLRIFQACWKECNSVSSDMGRVGVTKELCCSAVAVESLTMRRISLIASILELLASASASSLSLLLPRSY